MKKIGITGNIASGKTTVEHIIKNSGFNVIDADFICHNALDNDESIVEKIKKIFYGHDILNNNVIDRKKLGDIVFLNSNLKLQLENVLHPYVKTEIEKFFVNNSNEDLVFASVPLMYEIGMEKFFDKVILIAADENLRLQRLCQRNNFTTVQAKTRMNAQMSQDKKISLADFVIYNNYDLNRLEQYTKTVIEKLL